MKRKGHYRKSYKRKIKKPLWKKGFFWSILGSTVIIILIAYAIFFHSAFQLKNIEVSGGEEMERELIISHIYQKAQKKIVFINTASIFLFNSGSFEEEIMKNFPQVKEITLKKKLPHTLQLSMTGRVPFGQWCDNGYENCFLIDREGILFERIDFSPGKMLVVKTENEGDEGEKVLSSENASLILEIWQESGKDLGVWEFEIDGNTLKARTVDEWKILFNLRGDIESQLLRLKLIYSELFSGRGSHNLDYIDLRFEDRAYYKRKNN